jgi:serine/threonine protein kinase
LVVVEEIAAEISQIPGFDDRFQDRLALVAPCVHPNLIRLQPGGFTHHGRYYVMREHVEGHTLQHWMQNAELDPARVHQIILSLAGALEEFHRHGLVHSAMNAAQIWMDRDDVVKLEICPVSSFLEPEELLRLLGLEVVNAMPPEFTAGAIPTPQSDIYALATLYYELLTGTAPRGVITRLSSSLKVDIRVSSVILKALSQNPEERQTSMAEFCAPLLGNTAINTHVTQEGQSIAQGTSNGRVSKLFIAAAILLSIGSSVGSFFAWQAYQQKKKQSVPVTVTNEVKPTEDVDVPSAAILPRLGWVGIEGDANHALMELVLMNSEEIKSLCTPQSALNAETPGLPPVLTQYFF